MATVKRLPVRHHSTEYIFISFGITGPIVVSLKVLLVHNETMPIYNIDPLKPHFYIVKLGFTGVYIIFLISAQNLDCGYSLEPPHRVLNRNMKNIRSFYLNIFLFLVVKFSIYMYLNRRVFVM